MANPQQRSEAARKAVNARWARTAEERAYRRVIEEAVKAAVRAMPPLDPATRDKLAAILGAHNTEETEQ